MMIISTENFDLSFMEVHLWTRDEDNSISFGLDSAVILNIVTLKHSTLESNAKFWLENSRADDLLNVLNVLVISRGRYKLCTTRHATWTTGMQFTFNALKLSTFKKCILFDAWFSLGAENLFAAIGNAYL